MKHHRLTLVLLGAASLATLATSGRAVPATAPRPGPMSAQLPPVELWGYDSESHSMTTGDVRCEIIRDTPGQELGLSWSWRWGLGPADIVRDESALALDGYPTAVWVPKAYGVAYVAIDTTRGSTRIDKITFRPPTTLTGQNPQTGQVVHSLVGGQIRAYTTVFEADENGKRGVARIFDVLGSSDDLLVQFHDSRDVYHIDPQSGNDLRVATPGPAGAGEWSLPSLADSHFVAWRGEFDGIANAYVFVSRSGARCGLFDLDKNGLIDLGYSFTPAEWLAFGLNDLTRYQLEF